MLLPGQLDHHFLDLRLGADVDAAGGLIQDQQIRLRHQPAGDDGLLLVAAGEVANQLLRRGDLDLQQLDVLVGDPLLLLQGDVVPHALFGLKADDDVLPDGEVPDDALDLPILRAEGDLVVHGVQGGVEMDFPAVHPQCALFGLGHAGQKLCRFRAA